MCLLKQKYLIKMNKKTFSMQVLKLSAIFEERRGKQDIDVVVKRCQINVGIGLELELEFAEKFPCCTGPFCKGILTEMLSRNQRSSI